ncbi:ABC transporter permease [Staphylococcus lugdunensis]|uniref:ABC transporter permease n=1 Tax=Staphylococcus lugdunensis TaxID=28035 RepID=UPI00045976AA|nr:ABC transporter permease [Staphylococcus lugdunensis]KAK58430.1 ABC-2 family transporter protein [Staphylococcus lugdunensis VCU150]MCI2844890.1 ABC transporter permease [Staphylococcus lugdunensis]MDU4770306.1 ABC transporter permease [Staphylococcus lugdunensis]
MNLFLIEIKKLLFSKIFIFYCILVIFFVFVNCNQVIDKNINSDIYQPKSMTTYTTNNKVIMKNAIDNLKKELHSNNFKVYQFGFLKQKKLNKDKIDKIKTSLKNMENSKDFKRFKYYSNKVSHEIGWGSNYSEKNLYLFGTKQMSKEDFSMEKKMIKNKDLYFGAYSRYLSDIAGVIIGILPFFLGAHIYLLDRKNHVFKTINSRNISSFKLILTRVLALIMLSFLPILLFSVYFLISLSVVHPISIKTIFIFYEILFMWTTPTLLVASILGLLITMIFNSYLGSLIQIIIWFINLNIGSNYVEGHYGGLLIPRHNSLFNTSFFYNHLNDILINRISYCFIAILLLLISVWLFDLKRKGLTRSGKITLLRN